MRAIIRFLAIDGLHDLRARNFAEEKPLPPDVRCRAGGRTLYEVFKAGIPAKRSARKKKARKEVKTAA